VSRITCDQREAIVREAIAKRDALLAAGAAGVLGDPEVLDNADMAKTNKQRQEDFRARKIILEGMTEVRGLFFPPDRHAELKELAKKLLAETTKPPPAKGQER
jgi:hypothetical protein